MRSVAPGLAACAANLMQCCKPRSDYAASLTQTHSTQLHPGKHSQGQQHLRCKAQSQIFSCGIKKIKLHYTWRCWALPFVCPITEQNSHLNSNRLGSLLCLSVFKAIVVEIEACVKTDPHISNFTVIMEKLFYLTLHNSAFRLCCVTSD